MWHWQLIFFPYNSEVIPKSVYVCLSLGAFAYSGIIALEPIFLFYL